VVASVVVTLATSFQPNVDWAAHVGGAIQVEMCFLFFAHFYCEKIEAFGCMLRPVACGGKNRSDLLSSYCALLAPLFFSFLYRVFCGALSY